MQIDVVVLRAFGVLHNVYFCELGRMLYHFNEHFRQSLSLCDILWYNYHKRNNGGVVMVLPSLDALHWSSRVLALRISGVVQ